MKISNFFFALILCLGAFMIWHSYQPSARYETIIGKEISRKKFACIHNSQTQVEGPADVLIFGSSRAGSYFDDRILSRWVSDFSGDISYVQNMNVAGGDVSLSYQFLKEYLEKNDPDVVYAEVFRIKPQVAIIPYLNRAFSSTADWDMTTDLLHDFDDGRSGLFRVADMFRVIIDKADKYISKVLVREYDISVKNPKACVRNSSIKEQTDFDKEKSKRRFAALYERELTALNEKASIADTLREETNLPQRERVLKKYRDKIGPNWESTAPEDWGYGTDPAKRQLYYYKKMKELTDEKGVKLVYFRPYGLFESEFTPDFIDAYERLLGSDIIYPPYNISKLAYPYYVDPNHAGKGSQRAFALWLSEDILNRTGKF